MPFNGVSLACRWWPNIECWLGSFVIFQSPTLNAGLVALWFFKVSEPVLLRNPIFCDFSGGSGCPVPLLDPRISSHERLSCSYSRYLFLNYFFFKIAWGRELIAFLWLYSCCCVSVWVLCLFLTVPWVGLWLWHFLVTLTCLSVFSETSSEYQTV